jgi:hypothetical protein
MSSNATSSPLSIVTTTGRERRRSIAVAITPGMP